MSYRAYTCKHTEREGNVKNKQGTRHSLEIANIVTEEREDQYGSRKKEKKARSEEEGGEGGEDIRVSV